MTDCVVKSNSLLYETQHILKISLLRAVSLNLKFPYNQYEIAPFLTTGKALVQYMAISFAKGVQPLI